MKSVFRYRFASILVMFALVVALGGCAPVSVARWTARNLRDRLAAGSPGATLRVAATPRPPAEVKTDSAPEVTAIVAQTGTLLPVPAEPNSLVAADDRVLEDLYERVNPSVVNIMVVTRVRAGASSPYAPRVPGQQGQAPQDYFYQSGEGSGFVLDMKGHIVTNNHVVDGADEVRVTFPDDVSVTAKVVGRDPDSDLAVIKVDVNASELVPLPLGDSDELKVGQRVVAIGSPFGLEGSMTTGIVSALGRVLPTTRNAPTGGSNYSIPDIVQTDAAINPGNSGGPLLDYSGRVVGVNAAIESAVRSNSGVGFAIPVNLVKKVVPELIAKGSYEHTWLGISGASLSPAMAQAMNLGEDQRGILVGDVTKGSPAEQANLRPSQTTVKILGQDTQVGGDVIIKIDGTSVRKFDDLISFLVRNTSIGQTVLLTVLRDGKTIEVPVTLSARPKGN